MIKTICGMFQIPNPPNQQADVVDAVLVDEEAIGSVEKPGTGAKILHGMDALERYLNKLNSTDPVVRFLLPSPR